MSSDPSMWRMVIPYIFGSLSAWVPNGLATWHTARRSRHASLGRLLSILLEVRHQARVLVGMLELTDAMPDHPAKQGFISTVIPEMFPSLKNLEDDYDKTIQMLSEDSPVVAFRLRYAHQSIHRITAFAEKYEEFMVNESADGELEYAQEMFRRQMRPAMMKLMKERIEDAIDDVAKLHGLRTRIQVRNHYRNESSFAEILKELLDELSESTLMELLNQFPEDLRRKIDAI